MVGGRVLRVTKNVAVRLWLSILVSALVGFGVMLAPTASAAPPATNGYTVTLDRNPGLGGVILLAPADLLNNPAVPRAIGAIGAHDPVTLQVRARNGALLHQRVIPQGQEAGNFQIQTYRGQRVYTWWQGANGAGHGDGTYFVADRDFQVLHQLRTPAGTSGDLHEFRILPDGRRAAVTSYARTAAVVNGARVPVVDSHFYIIDIDSGRTEFSWDALSHVPVTATTTPLPLPGQGLDYFHINSIFPDGKGNYLVSSRNTSALYLVDGTTGAVRAVIGGNRSTMRVADNATFRNQHDAELLPDGTIRLFDNNSSLPGTGGPSSILTIRPDWKRGTVSLVSRWTHPDHLTAWAMGNAETLPDGSVFGGWGTTGHVSSLDRTGRLIYDATLSGMMTTYRAFWYPQGL
ncbi:aryl-sulfate sulfotransferase [Gordonia polyisoprenivorans]|nr:aryl-sulfate sulfotransferase [Gordonia polyisoprenivorans]